MLEKIKEYLDNPVISGHIKWDLYFKSDKMAKDITEICRLETLPIVERNIELVKEKDAINGQLISMMGDRNDEYFKAGKLEKENLELKNKLINYNPTKQLELEEEIAELKSKISRLEANEKIYHERLKGIKDKIINILDDYIYIRDFCGYSFTSYTGYAVIYGIDGSNDASMEKSKKITIEQIADEILKGE
jgi:hypothetical protein